MLKSLFEEKQSLRESLSDPKTWSTQVKLSDFFDFHKNILDKKYVGLYKPLKDEITIDFGPAKIKSVWPKIKDSKKSTMTFAESDDFELSSCGFKEPAGESFIEVSADDIAVIFVPGLAFDYSGARLGRGRGFYDRYLSSFKGIKVGVCHWTRFLNKPIPVDYGHDVFMDWILTDRHLYKVNDLKEKGADKQIKEVS